MKKLKISKLNVESFITSTDSIDKIKGGTGTCTITGEITKTLTTLTTANLTCPVSK